MTIVKARESSAPKTTLCMSAVWQFSNVKQTKNIYSKQYRYLSFAARPLPLKLRASRTLLRKECIAGQSQTLGLA